MKAWFCWPLFPYVGQTLAISLFTLGSVWLLARVLGFREARDRIWLFSLPFLVPWVLPARPVGLVRLVTFTVGPTLLGLHRGLVVLVISFLTVVVTGIQIGVSYLAYRRLLAGARELAPDDAPRLFAVLAPLVRKAGVPMPRVLALPPERGIVIFVCGTRRPRLVVAPALLTALPVSELRAILAHEVAHLVRRDQVFSWVTFVLRGLMFYNPVLYPLTRWLRQEREKAADVLASEWTGQPLALARGLVKVAGLALAGGPPRRIPLLASAELTSGGALTQRVHLLLAPSVQSGRVPRSRVLVFWLLFLGLQGAFSLVFRDLMFLHAYRHVPPMAPPWA